MREKPMIRNPIKSLVADPVIPNSVLHMIISNRSPKLSGNDFRLYEKRRMGSLRLRSLLLLVIVGVVLVSVGVIGYKNGWFGKKKVEVVSESSDPRLLYSGPFENINPKVEYVGDAMCSACHGTLVESYHQHAMGKSLKPIDKIANQQVYDSKHHMPFEVDGSEYSVEICNGKVWHHQIRKNKKGEILFDRKMPIDYAVGSGTRGYSYLTDRDGYLFQSFISWYTQKQIWDLSPGFQYLLPHFDERPISSDCVVCHANRVQPVYGSMNQYKEPLFDGYVIGCERCHGPGRLHVQRREATPKIEGIDYSIVNPKHLEASLREAICQQCHLEGVSRVARLNRHIEEFRPGLPLEDFVYTFVKDHRGDDRHAVNHVEQMYLSPCFQKSNGKMGCITCHPPHEKIPAEKMVSFQRQNCNKCHDDCSIPLSARHSVQNNCITCHMPRYSTEDIVHTASTSHLIVRKPFTKKELKQEKRITGNILIFPFNPPELTDPEQARAWSVALLSQVPQGTVSINQTQAALQRTTELFPNDADSWGNMGLILEHRNQFKAALENYEKALKIAPNNEYNVIRAAGAAMNINDLVKSKGYWEKAIELNPHNLSYRSNLVRILTDAGSWDQAKQHIDFMIERDPSDDRTRFFYMLSLLYRNQLVEAENQFRILEELNPSALADYRRKYQQAKRKLDGKK